MLASSSVHDHFVIFFAIIQLQSSCIISIITSPHRAGLLKLFPRRSGWVPNEASKGWMRSQWSLKGPEHRAISLLIYYNVYISSLIRRNGTHPHFGRIFDFEVFNHFDSAHSVPHIFWNSQFLIRCNFCVIITFVESCHFICPNN